MSTLIFVRRRIVGPFFALAQQLEVGKKILVSDEKYVTGAVWWGSPKYSQASDYFEFSENEIAEVIARCRFLRLLSAIKARNLIGLAQRRWLSIVEENSIERIISLPIDSYVTHVLLLVARKKSIPMISVIGTPFSGRMRFTLFGEFLGRTGLSVDKLAVEFIEQSNSKTIRPNWLIGIDADFKIVVARRLLLDSLKSPAFFFYRIFSGDFDSFSFAKRSYMKRRMFSTLPRFMAALKVEKTSSSVLPESFALLPLQFYPESTSDYWIPEAKMHNHHKVVLDVVRVLSKSISIVIKEHPAACGRRSAEFLAELLNIPNVQFVPMHASMAELMKRSSFLVGQASTTTFQAQAMGKKVLFLGTPFFAVLKKSAVLKNTDVENLVEAYQRICTNGDESAPDEAQDMVKEFLSSTGEATLGGYSPIFEKSALSKVTSFASKDIIAIYRALV